jgi:rhamnosyltransferase
MGSGENVGIATALNAIFNFATRSSIEYIVTFDQDSTVSKTIVRDMLGFMKRLSSTDDHIAAIGPLFADEREKKVTLPVFQAGRAWVKKVNSFTDSSVPIETSIVITSGMLVKLSSWQHIGGFRDDLFIDHVDTEWCLRAISMGYKLLICPQILMPHEISDEPPKRFLGRLVLMYSPVRRYYYFRNTVALLQMRHTPFGLKAYLFLTLCYRFMLNLAIDESRLRSLHAMSTGIIHGITGKMGKMNNRKEIQ